MDLYCPRCSEPCDSDEFHYVEDLNSDVEGALLSWATATGRFRTIGCAALEGGTTPTCEKDDSLRSLASATLMDLMGDDLDGVASTMDDFEFLGMLDG